MSLNNLQSQYVETNIETLLNGLNDIFIKYTGKPVEDFFYNIYDLSTAAGIGLDLWGVILNFPRVIKFSSEENPEVSTKTLTDDEYRLILKLLALQTKTNMTISEINKHLMDLFSLYNTRAYCQDRQDMTYVNYVFEWKIPDWLKSAFNNYELLPHPQGVGVKYEEALAAIIGFEGQNLTNFYRAIFNKEESLEYSIMGFEGQYLGIFYNSIFIDENKNEEGDDNGE